jgi:hypothetical protein
LIDEVLEELLGGEGEVAREVVADEAVFVAAVEAVGVGVGVSEGDAGGGISWRVFFFLESFRENSHMLGICPVDSTGGHEPAAQEQGAEGENRTSHCIYGTGANV